MENKLYKEAVKLAEKNKHLRTSDIQIRFRVGYAKASRVWNRLVDEGLVEDNEFNKDEQGDYIRGWNLYVLKLKDDKYYVGITTKSPKQRMQDHIDRRNGAYWTAMHEPLEVIYSKDLGKIPLRKAERQENMLVRELMKQRGINNVRGGDLTMTDELIQRFGWYISREDWKLIRAMIFFMVIMLFVMAHYIYLAYFK